MVRRTLALTLFVFSSVPAVAAADWLVSPFVGARFGGNTNLVLGRVGTEKSKFTFGSSVGFLTDGVLGVEGDLAFIPGFFSNDLAVTSSLVTTLMGNVIAAVPLEMTQYGLRPYVIGGAGLIRARGDFGVDPVIASNLFGVSVGGGAIGPLSPRSSLRLDLRYVRSVGGDPDATTADMGEVQLSFWRATAGLSFRF